MPFARNSLPTDSHHFWSVGYLPGALYSSESGSFRRALTTACANVLRTHRTLLPNTEGPAGVIPITTYI